MDQAKHTFQNSDGGVPDKDHICIWDEVMSWKDWQERVCRGEEVAI